MKKSHWIAMIGVLAVIIIGSVLIFFNGESEPSNVTDNDTAANNNEDSEKNDNGTGNNNINDGTGGNDGNLNDDNNENGIVDPEDIPEGMYQNPVFEPVFADPSIVRGDDGYFYAYGTEDDWGDGQGGKVAPIIRSSDLVDWEYIGGAFESKPSWKEGWVWAPEVQKLNDKYYMYYTKSTWGDENPGIGVAVAESPEGPFEDHGKLTDTKEMGVYSIDPMLFVEDETPYLFFGGITSGIFAIELSSDGLSTVGDRIDVIGPGYEAPYIVKRDGYYYLFGSNGSCCNGAESSYNVGVGRSESLLGPYENKAGQNLKNHRGEVLLFGYLPVEEGKGHIVGPGHNAIITDDAGTDWIVYHGIPADNPVLSSGATRRPMFIDKIEWVDGWPVIEGAIPSITPQEAPYIEN